MISMVEKLFKFKNLQDHDFNIILNVIATFLIKGLALVISLFTMPAYISYFENEFVLGLWFTMLSVLSWILTFDLGIGNGLRNHLVPYISEGNTIEIKKHISSAYLSIGAVVIIMMILSLLIFPLINWNSVFNVENVIISRQALTLSAIIVFSGIMIQFLLKLITSILYAMQKSAIINLLALLNSVILLLFVSCADISNIESRLLALAAVQVFSVNFPLFIATIIVFSKSLRKCWPNIKYYDSRVARKIIKLGGMFFWVQMMYMIISTTNEFLITWLADPSYVVEYQIYNKLFTLLVMVFTLALTPVWSAVTKAYTEKNYMWIKKVYSFLKMLTILAVVFELLMIPFLQYVVKVWLGENYIKINYLYAIIFAISGSLVLWNGVLSSIANGTGKLKVQTLSFTIGALLKIPMAIIFVKILGSWIGVVVANIFALGIYCIIEPIVLEKYIGNLVKSSV